MTFSAQNLYIVWVGPARKVACVAFDMVPLKIFSCPTILAFSSRLNNLRNCFSNGVTASTGSTFPQRMVFSPHLNSSPSCQACVRAIASSLFAIFFNGKGIAAGMARTIYKLCRFSGFDNLSTFFRTSVCRATIVASKNFKLFFAGWARQANLASSLYFSRSV